MDTTRLPIFLTSVAIAQQNRTASHGTTPQNWSTCNCGVYPNLNHLRKLSHGFLKILLMYRCRPAESCSVWHPASPINRLDPMSTQRTMSGGWAGRENLPKGTNGRHLCRWCNLEVPKGRVTFCSAWCVEEWRVRSDPGYIREKVLERDRGVCAGCGTDCLHAERQ